MNETRGDESLSPDSRWNFFAFLVDYTFFGAALSFYNADSVLPALVRRLTQSSPLVGLVTTVFRGGWLLPQLGAGRFVDQKARRKPYLVLGMSGRIVVPILAFSLWFGLGRHPTVLLVVLFVGLAFFALADGFGTVAWFDIFAETIPPKRRGHLMAVSQVTRGLLGLAVGKIISSVLSSPGIRFPDNYALIFGLASLAFIPSTFALGSIREPARRKESSSEKRDQKERWFAPLLADPQFRYLMACEVLVGLYALASPFYVAHATEQLDLSESVVGSFVAAQQVTGVVSGVVLGLLGRHWRPSDLIRISSAVSITGPLFALFAHLTADSFLIRIYPVVYVALGVYKGCRMMGFYNYLLSSAPEAVRPSYVGLANTIMGGLTVAPILGGWLLEASSYVVLFGVTASLVSFGFLLSLGLKPGSAGDKSGGGAALTEEKPSSSIKSNISRDSSDVTSYRRCSR